MKAVTKYPGSKWSLASWIISHFPKHHSYLEPYFGSGAVLFCKPRSNIETVNDLDHNVVNLFACIRENPQKLASMIYMTPYAREIYERAYKEAPEDKFEAALNFYIRLNMGHGFRTTGEKVGWKNDVQGKERSYASQDWCSLPDKIIQAAERLRGVQIESMPAVELIKRFNYEKVLIYCDPPYMLETRHGKQYRHVSMKEGFCSHKVADLDTFWRGQKNIVLLDPNITACKDWRELFWQLIDSKARIDFSQGLDIHMMTRERAEMIKQMKISNIHFAWDRYEDKNIVLPKFEIFKKITGLAYQNLTVYMLTNFDTTTDEDLERVYILRDLGFNPYVMIYNKDDFTECDKNGKPIRLKPEHELQKKYSKKQIDHFNTCWKLQQWVNNRIIFRTCKKFEDFDRRKRKAD